MIKLTPLQSLSHCLRFRFRLQGYSYNANREFVLKGMQVSLFDVAANEKKIPNSEEYRAYIKFDEIQNESLTFEYFPKEL